MALNDDPTMADVVRATPDTPAGNAVLDFIFRHQEAERAHRDGMMEDWLIRDEARLRLLRDGVSAAIAGCDRLGTTGAYEDCLGRITQVLHWSHGMNRVHDYYVQRATEAWPRTDYPEHEVFTAWAGRTGWA